jgi:hypothetical protein
MPNRNPAADGSHDFLLVFGVAAAALGFVLMSRGVPPSPVMARQVPSRYASPMLAERSLTAADDHPAADRSPPVGVTPISVQFPDNSGDVACADACPSQYDPRRDLRVTLTDMMLQQRGFAGHPPDDMPRPESRPAFNATIEREAEEYPELSPAPERWEEFLTNTSTMWAADSSPPDRIPSTPATRTARNGATGLLGPCGPHFDLGHDLGQDLAAMAQHGRRVDQECPTGPSATPATLGVPENCPGSRQGGGIGYLC